MSTVISPPAIAQAPQSRRVVMSTAAAVAATSARKAAPGGRVAAKHVSPVSAVLAENTAVQPPEAVAGMWREVQGADDWAGMMEPLHPVLRSEVVRYGELVAAAYKAFDVDPTSARYLKCKHGQRAMLREAGMGGAGYDITQYVYATPDGDRAQSRWIGYVAVADNEAARRLGRRDIVVAFRGTATAPEWAGNLRSTLAAARFDAADPLPDVKVESGFLSLYTSDDATAKFTCGSCRNQILAEVARLVGKHKHEDVSITLAGHSMGSSLAILLAYDLAELSLNRVAIDASASSGNGKTKASPITVYSFAGPRVGNAAFKDRCDELGIKVLRVVNVNDPITKLPGVFLNESSLALAGGRLKLPWSCACYTHVGVELAIDFFEARDPACMHDLEVYIGLLKEPKAASMARRREKGVVSKAKQFVLERNFDTWRWQMAAVQVSGLVQALGM